MEFTGERFVPNQTSLRVQQDHIERYLFASDFVVGKKVLDIACGSGYGSDFLLKKGAASVTGVDVSAQAVDHAQQNYKSEHLSFVVFDAEKYLSEEKYDIIVSFETIEHVSDFKKVLHN